MHCRLDPNGSHELYSCVGVQPCLLVEPKLAPQCVGTPCPPGKAHSPCRAKEPRFQINQKSMDCSVINVCLRSSVSGCSARGRCLQFHQSLKPQGLTCSKNCATILHTHCWQRLRKLDRNGTGLLKTQDWSAANRSSQLRISQRRPFQMRINCL